IASGKAAGFEVLAAGSLRSDASRPAPQGRGLRGAGREASERSDPAALGTARDGLDDRREPVNDGRDAHGRENRLLAHALLTQHPLMRFHADVARVDRTYGDTPEFEVDGVSPVLCDDLHA